LNSDIIQKKKRNNKYKYSRPNSGHENDREKYLIMIN